ncbi:hypothetical protein H6B33_09835 [Gemmiger formicilis]|uniref:hypothetical protein n=1 Tax=Gemmiger formicilis TaxID=745368 RepID=UPI00195B7B45|nr:hypothetical protein [Gemmiger formicilis]MBM6915700.1 hypothetical protein [Gemmiger formicilis]
MKKLTKILALGLAAALLLAGCAIKTPATVGTVGDTTITAGVYLLAQYEAFVRAKALASETDVNAVLKATITDEDGNETTGADYVSAKTLEGVYRYAAAEQKYAEMGGELSESDLALITEQVDTQWESMEDTYTANGIGYQSLMAWAENSYKQEALLDMLYGQDGTEPVSDADLTAYAEENFFRFSYLLLPYFDMSTFSTLDEDQQAQVLEMAQEAAGKTTSSEDLQAMAEEYLPQVGELLGNGMGADSAANYMVTGALVNYDTLTSYLGEDAAGQVKAMAEGEVRALESTGYNYGAVVVVKEAVFNDTTTLDTLRDDALWGLKYDELQQQLADEGAAAAALDQSAMNTYSPRKIKG